MNKIRNMFIVLFALVASAMQAEFSDEVFNNTKITVGEALQVCKDVSVALSTYTGMELCEALKQPYSVLQDKGITRGADELFRLHGHLEMLSDSWRLERLLAEPDREVELFWGFTLEQTKKLAFIQAEEISAGIAYIEGSFTLDSQDQETIKRVCKLTEIYLERAEFAVEYLKEIKLLKEAYIKENPEAAKTLSAVICRDDIDEQEFFLAIEETIEKFNHFLDGRYRSQEIKALYEDRVRAVLQELESLYVPAAKA